MINALILATAIAAQGPAGADEKFNLTRNYIVGDEARYALEMSLGDSERATATVAVKVAKTMETGADLKLKVEKFAFLHDGGDVGIPAPSDRTQRHDKYGLPTSVSVEEAEFIFVLLAMPAYLPGQMLRAGEGFDIKWEAPDKSFKWEGKATLVEVTTTDGKRIAKIKATADGTPHGETTGHVEYTSFIDLADGKLVSTKGTIRIEDQTGNFEVKKL